MRKYLKHQRDAELHKVNKDSYIITFQLHLQLHLYIFKRAMVE